MLINPNLSLPSAIDNARPSQERRSHSLAGPEADSLPASPALATTSVPAKPQLTTVQGTSDAETQPIEDLAAANAATDYAKNSFLQNPGTALLAQANQLPQTVLDLLQ